MEFRMLFAFIHTLLLLNASGQMFQQSTGQSLSTYYSSGIRRSVVECVNSCAQDNACNIVSFVTETKNCFLGNDTEAVVSADGSVVYKPAPPLACPNGWTLVGERCLSFVSTRSTWYDSQAYCASLGANLAHVYSLQDLEDVKIFVPCAPNECFPWLGLNDQEVEGVFRSPGGHNVLPEVVNLLNDFNTLDDNCVYIHTSLQYVPIYTYDCSETAASICEQNAFLI